MPLIFNDTPASPSAHAPRLADMFGGRGDRFAGPFGGDADDPILLLDSGLGGMTVAKAIRQRLPRERLVYVGDTARVPYGSKSPAAIRAAACGVLRAALSRLSETGRRPKHVVVACNSASANALEALRDTAGDAFGVTGVIQSGVRTACAAGGSKTRPTIGVIATEATIRSRAYDTAIALRRPRAHLLLRATPMLVPIVEEGRKAGDPLVDLALRQYLTPMLRRAKELAEGLDVLVLGCTHYPALLDAIRKVVGEETTIVDSAGECAADVAERLDRAGLLRAMGDPAPVRVMATDVTSRFSKLACRLLGETIEAAELLTVEDGAAQDAEPMLMRA